MLILAREGAAGFRSSFFPPAPAQRKETWEGWGCGDYHAWMPSFLCAGY